MRIGIDARMYSESGIGRYIRNLISQLEKLDSQSDYFVFLIKKDFDKVKFNNNFQKVLADFKWYGLAEQIKMPKLLNKYTLDLVHFPHFNVPIFFNGKFVVTIHDLIHQHFEMRRATTRDPLTYKIKQMGYRSIFANAVSKSEKIIVPSEFVKKQLIDDWKVDQEKIVVTYEGVDQRIINLQLSITKKKNQQVLTKFEIRPPYIFYVGNAHPHKNVEGLIKAFFRVKSHESRVTENLKLVLSGADHYFWQRIKGEFMGSLTKSENDAVRKDIIFTGGVTDEELVALYKSAECFVMPSLEEGFGLPLLEAFVCETPVVSSDRGSLREIGGDACLYFDPSSPRHPERSEGSNKMKEKIMEVLSSEKIRNELIEKGKKRIKDFSWEKLTKETLRIYES